MEIKQDEKKKKLQNATTYTYTLDSNGDPRRKTYIIDILYFGEKLGTQKRGTDHFTLLLWRVKRD